MEPAHIRTARENGAKAGFNAYVETLERSGLPQVQAQLKELRSQGNKRAQFDFYCSKFGSKFAGRGTNNVQIDEPVGTSSKIGQLARALGIGVGKAEALLALVGDETDGVQVEDNSLDDVDDDYMPETPTKRGPGRPKGSKNKAKTTTPANGDDQFAPRDPDLNCTSGRLWKLNEAGLLRIVGTPGDPISCGEAHKVIRQIVA